MEEEDIFEQKSQPQHDLHPWTDTDMAGTIRKTGISLCMWSARKVMALVKFRVSITIRKKIIAGVLTAQMCVQRASYLLCVPIIRYNTFVYISFLLKALE